VPTQRRNFDMEFECQILREVDAGTTVASVAREHGVHPETIRLWKRQQRKYGERAFAGNGNSYSDEAKIAELERTLGRIATENALLEKSYQDPAAVEPKRRRAALIREMQNQEVLSF
jgi:transposase